jgi:hypothetical protein
MSQPLRFRLDPAQPLGDTLQALADMMLPLTVALERDEDLNVSDAHGLALLLHAVIVALQELGEIQRGKQG